LRPKKVYNLYQLSKSIQNVLKGYATQSYWVKAEILKLNYYEQSGHAYPDLVDKQNEKLKAQFKSTIWKANFDSINAKFREIGDKLKDNMTIVAKVSVNYHSVHGLSLNIIDIDTDYTLGELARKKQEAIKALKKEELFYLNKSRKLALLPKTIAIISVQSSKGFGDFEDILAKNPKQFQFHYKLFPAVLQGEKAITTISNQLEVIKKHSKLFDAVAIIRGGGDEVGFSAYDDYSLAKTVALCPIPVLTGIGHSSNRTVTELVSFKSFITPTKLAEFLVEQFDLLEQKLSTYTRDLEKFALNEFNLKTSALDNLTKLFEVYTLNQIRQENNNLLQLKSQLIKSTTLNFQNETRKFEIFQQKLKLLHPQQTLKRGFSITSLNGKTIFDAKLLKKGDRLNTTFYKGTVESKVEKHPKS
jgi:exodeoxyribonuclease VII large subunit